MEEELKHTEEENGGGVGEAVPWDILPLHLWEHILSRLPISTLAIASSVSRTFLSLLRSSSFLSLYRSIPAQPHQDLLFLLFSSPSFAASYHPFLDRWIPLHLHLPLLNPNPFPLLLASGGPHLLLQLPSSDTLLLASNPLSPTPPPLTLPPMLPHPPSPYPLSLLPLPRGAHAIVAVSTSDRIRSQIYDSSTRCWTPGGELDLRVSVIGSAAEVDGVLYCLGRGPPDTLLRFDLGKGEWGVVEVELPPLACSHVAAFGGRLWLVGGVEELGDVVGVEVWEMEWGTGWRDAGLMPAGLFRRLLGSGMGGFEVVDGRGVVCFCNTARGSLIACDLREMRWWRPMPCPFKVARGKDGWLGHAVEPRVELLLPRDRSHNWEKTWDSIYNFTTPSNIEMVFVKVKWSTLPDYFYYFFHPGNVRVGDACAVCSL